VTLPVPKFQIKDIETKRDRLVSIVFAPLVGTVINAENLTRQILDTLPGIPADAMFESVRYLAGTTLTHMESVTLAWRIAGNIPTLKAGLPVQPWTFQRVDEWLPLQVLRMDIERNRYNRLGYDVTFRVLAGSACPNKINRFWTLPSMHVISQELGFSKPWGKFPFKHPKDLIRLRLTGLVEAEKSRTQPVFHAVTCSDAMIKYNREQVLRLRLRVGMECPHRYAHECVRCAVGYDSCPAGTHASTYYLGNCLRCGQNNVLFDPEQRSQDCITCNDSERLKTKSS
jgi:hypothetical protein